MTLISSFLALVVLGNSPACAAAAPRVFVLSSKADVARMSRSLGRTAPAGRARLSAAGRAALRRGPAMGVVLPGASRAVIIPADTRARGASVSTAREGGVESLPAPSLLYDTLGGLLSREAFRDVEASYAVIESIFNGPRSRGTIKVQLRQQAAVPGALAVRTSEVPRARQEVRVWNKRTSRLERLPVRGGYHVQSIKTDERPLPGGFLAALWSPRLGARLALVEPLRGRVTRLPRSSRVVPLDEARLSPDKKSLLYVAVVSWTLPGAAELVSHEWRTGTTRRVSLGRDMALPRIESISRDGRVATVIDSRPRGVSYRIRFDARSGRVISTSQITEE